MRTRTSAGLLVAGLTLALGASVGVTATASAAPSDNARAHARAALGQARAALQGDNADRAHATDALRQLVMTKDALSGDDARKASALLARPSNGVAEFEGAPVWPKSAKQFGRCGDNVCVHWVEQGTHAAKRTFVKKTLAAAEKVAKTYIGAGYRAVLRDEGQGSKAIKNRKPDIYLANIGPDGLYGYCTSDADEPVKGLAYYAFCVLDNDYSAEEFPSNTPLGNMRVTAAHEYFHAVQYAYDGWDDTWVYEATATWAEDELFDDVNDNYFYLPYGQMGDPAASEGYQGEGPGVSLDYGEFAYGNWIFYRYLAENFTQSRGGMSTIVRDIWRHLDTTKGTDRYSLQAVSKTLADRGTTMGKQYGDFSVRNRTPELTYAEGSNYPVPAAAFSPVQLSGGQLSATRSVTLDHLTSGTGAFLPFGDGYTLDVSVDMTPTSTGSRAAVTVFDTAGNPTRTWIPLDANGDGSQEVGFSSSTVDRVEVTLVNASTQMRDCGTDQMWLYSCGGFGQYENQVQEVTVTAVS